MSDRYEAMEAREMAADRLEALQAERDELLWYVRKVAEGAMLDDQDRERARALIKRIEGH